MEHNYAYVAQGKSARACQRSINASFKDLSQVCRNVRGMDAQAALAFLELAAKKEAAIRFYRHNAGMGHRRELGGAKGGWPVKSVRAVKEVLENAVANGQGLASPYIAHIIANKQASVPRLSPKGRRMRMDYETAFVEIVLVERAGAEKAKTESKMEKAKTEGKETDAQKAKIQAAEPGEKETGEEKAATDAKMEKAKAGDKDAEKTAEGAASEEKKREEKVEQKLERAAENAAQKAAVHSHAKGAKKPGG